MAATAASEKRIIGWIEDMIDEQLASSTDLSVALKDGIALCKLVNKIRAGSVPYINTNPGVLNHLENISAYLQACWTLGVPTDAIFGTQDLHQRRNIESVIKNLDSLAAVTVTSNDSSFTTESQSQAPTATRDEIPTITREEAATVTQNTSSSPSDTKTSQAYNEELQAENEELQEENESLRRRLRKLQTIIEENEANIVDKDKEIQEITSKLDQATLKLKEHEEKKPETPILKQSAGDLSDLEKKDERITQLEEELQEQKRAFIELVTRFATLEEENTKLKEQNQQPLMHSDSDSSMSSRSSSASSINGNSQTGLRMVSPREDRRKARQETGKERRKKRESSTVTLADVLEKKEGIEREMEKDKDLRFRHRRVHSSTALGDSLGRDGEKKKGRYKKENSSVTLNEYLERTDEGIEKEKRKHERENSGGGGSELGSHRTAVQASSSPPTGQIRQPRSEKEKEKEKADENNKYAARRSASEEVVKSENSTPHTPRKRTDTPEPPDSRNSSPKEEKRKNGLAGRALRGIRERIGSMRSNKEERPNTASDLTSLVKNIFNAPSTVTFQDVVKVNFKKDTSRRLFSLILDQHMGSFTLKSHELTSHAFDMLLYLVNASLLAMGDETETDTIALQVLMRSSFFFYKKEKGGDKQFMQLHVRSYDVWKRFEFWEEYFYSEVGIHAKTRKDDPKLVYDVLSEFVLRMKDFGVGGGLVQKLVNDVSSKDLLNQDELASLLKSANPSAPPTPTAVNSPNTVPVMLRHTFTQKSIRKPAFCDYCSEFIWGVSKVVFFCNDCKYTIHRKCLDECLPSTACSSKRSFGTPFAVSHNVSVTRSANGGIEGLPKEWQDLLEQSGIGKEDALANPHTMLHILEYHTAQAKKNATQKLMPTATQRARKANPHPPLPSFNQNQQPSSSSSSHIDTPRENGAENPPPLEDDEPETPSSSTKVDDILNTGDPNTLYSDMTQIGQGANAEVYLGVNTKTSEKVAIKKIRWDPEKSQALINEIQIMKSIKHKNVINCSECFLLQDELWVTMEYIDFGSLTEIIDLYSRGKVLSEAEIAFICFNVLKALENVHNLGIIHRDVKTDNILCGTDGRILLADFGSAARLSPDRPNRKTVIGSPYWMAPELIRGEEYTQKVDIFSFGCMLRELATGDPPFADLPPLKTLFLLATSEVPPLKNVEGKKWSGAFLDFCNKCVRKDPAVRPGAADLLLHPFLGMACTQEEFANNVIAPAMAARDKGLPIFGN